MAIIYITLDQAIETHRNTVLVSGGGSLGVLELCKLDSVLTHIQNDDYYPTFADKLTHLLYCACKFHCFEDGNKRFAVSLGTQILLFNGYLYCAKHFLRDMENIIRNVAAGKINKELLREIVEALLNEEMDSEFIKFKIYEAINP
jgi:death on curing protein